MKLTGKTVNELMKELLKNVGVVGVPSYPLKLDYILDKEVVFKVDVKKDNIDKHDEDFVVENDMISTSNTPVKRSISKSESFVVEIDDDPNAQLSSSKVKRVEKMRKSHESQHLSFTMD
ncbi:hypothetical protein P3L10_000413 [Capsicum annuum]